MNVAELKTYKLLKREKIEATIFDFSDSDLRRTEASENLLQSGGSPSELLAIRRFFLAEEREKAGHGKSWQEAHGS